jgi:hypothetical protein
VNLICRHLFIKVTLVNFWFECTVWVSFLCLRNNLPFINGDSGLLMVFSNYFLTLGVYQGLERHLLCDFFVFLLNFGLDIILFDFSPAFHFVVVLLWSPDTFSFILLLDLAHVPVKLYFKLLISLFLSFLLYFFILLIFHFSILQNLFRPHVNRIESNLRHQGLRMRIN